MTKLIKIPGKSWFDELTPAEVGLMIESFLSDSNEHFDPLAFNDFLHANLKDPDLIRIQSELNEKAFVPAERGAWPVINNEYLTALSKALIGQNK